MDTTGPLFFVLFVVAAMLLFEAAQSFIASRRSGPDKSKTKKRLQSLAARIMVPEADEERSLLRKEQSTQGIDGWISALPFAGALELQLYRAGMAMSVKRFIGISIAIGAAGLIAAVAFLSATPASGIGVFAGLLPWLQARRLGRKRAEAFEKQFPDALDLLIRALRAGHALTAGLQMVGEELQAPISEEFMLTADEIQLGKDVTEALSNMSYRVESSDLPFFVVAITIQQETGSNLAEVLENLSHVIRERFKLYGKVRALTALGRATANLLAVWPVVMVGALYSVNPDYIAPLWEDPTGHTFAIVAFFMIVVGYVLCRRMAKIEV
jgi:tight adherence protein B